MTTNSGKNSGKTMRSPRSGAVVPTGAHPGATGGKKGRSGRKPDEFKAFMRSLVSLKSVSQALRGILENPAHPDFVKAYKMAAEFGYGRPTQALEVSGTEGAPMQLKVVHEVIDPANAEAVA